MSRSRRNKACRKACCSPTKARRQWGEERPRDKRESYRLESTEQEAANGNAFGSGCWNEGT